MNNRPNQEPEKSYALYRHQETVKLFESKSDPEIWSAFNQGDEMAFNYLFRIYTPLLFRYGCQFRVEEALVEDSIQNLFIYLRKKRGDLSQVSSIKAYLFKSLQRELFKHLKSDKNRVAIEEDDPLINFQLELSAESSIIENELNQEIQEKLKHSIESLTSRQRQAILLFYEEGMSYKDIAEVMDFNEVKSARKLIYRAIATLKACMDQQGKK
ncbi:RNA polymerase sigma factor [Algoriphagus sp. AK58]|uniref:RNA polymerase sigma factor n=1 Tax=Algoriphagus sp. AK58 TaxID=1406877 RepID=UPI001650A257|nr:sigma-70 family RNA polymerase sigma factor [Algoriphagus sp. AK58]MBC6366169.1 RNA polymerase subunit sigma-24 [Algoriphagus sp. AK58]